jgi:hypothetical protein
MNARFRVEQTFAINLRSFFVVSGVVTEGEIAVGQYLCAPFNLGVPIEAIEWVLRRDYREEPALVFRYRDAAELARWKALEWAGQVLDVTTSLERAGPLIEMSNDR